MNQYDSHFFSLFSHSKAIDATFACIRQIDSNGRSLRKQATHTPYNSNTILYGGIRRVVCPPIPPTNVRSSPPFAPRQPPQSQAGCHPPWRIPEKTSRCLTETHTQAAHHVLPPPHRSAHHTHRHSRLGRVSSSAHQSHHRSPHVSTHPPLRPLGTTTPPAPQ